MGEGVLLEMLDVISIIFADGKEEVGRETVHNIRIEVFVTIRVEVGFDGRADAKVHSSSVAAAVGACAGAADC
jgi:hypothetical protein